MAKKLLISLNDVRAETFSAPVPALTKGEAIRQFDTIIKDKKGNVGLYPLDHYLYVVGSFDESTGLVSSLEKPLLIASGLDFVQPDA